MVYPSIAMHSTSKPNASKKKKKLTSTSYQSSPEDPLSPPAKICVALAASPRPFSR